MFYAVYFIHFRCFYLYILCVILNVVGITSFEPLFHNIKTSWKFHFTTLSLFHTLIIVFRYWNILIIFKVFIVIGVVNTACYISNIYRFTLLHSCWYYEIRFYKVSLKFYEVVNSFYVSGFVMFLYNLSVALLRHFSI